LSEMMKSLHGH